VLFPLKLLLNEVAVLGSFPLKFLFPFLPSWSRSNWLSVFSRHAFQVLCRAPRSNLADPPPGVCSILLPLRYKVMTSLCGPLVGSSSPGGSTRVPFLPSWGRCGCRHPELPTRSRDLPVGSWGVIFSVGAATLVPLLGNHFAFSPHRN